MVKIKRFFCSFLALILLIGFTGPGVGNANTVQDNSNQIVYSDVINDTVLSEELVEIEQEIDNYLEEIPYAESDYENMSDDEFEEVYTKYFESNEFLQLEKEHETLHNEIDGDQTTITPRIAPILIPIAAAAARVALKTIVKQGNKIATKYLKNKLKSVGKKYKLEWNVKNSKGKITSLLKITHKPSKTQIFRLDNGKLGLKPGTNDWFWHYHIGDTKGKMSHHYSLRSFVPSKYKPLSNTTLY